MSAFKSIDEILENVEQLPTMSQAILEIIGCIDDPDVGVDELVKTISLDIGLTTSILKVANTARFSGQGHISNISNAVMVLGLKQIREMVCVLGVKESFPQIKSSSFDYTNFWRHSVAVAVCSKILGQLAGASPAIGFVSGMLHDIGQLVLAMTAPDEFRMVMEYRASHDCQVIEAEQVVLGIDHAKIGAYLARKWNLPEVICSAIEHHHMPDVVPTINMADLVHVSEVLAHALEIGYIGRPVPPMSERALFRLSINFPRLKPYLAQIECEYLYTILMLN